MSTRLFTTPKGDKWAVDVTRPGPPPLRARFFEQHFVCALIERGHPETPPMALIPVSVVHRLVHAYDAEQAAAQVVVVPTDETA